MEAKMMYHGLETFYGQKKISWRSQKIQKCFKLKSWG